MPRLTLAWRIKDDMACPICLSLNGYSWTFIAGKDEFPQVLTHPIEGTVWDLEMDESRAHGDHTFHCRCHLEPLVDLTDVLGWAQDVEGTL